MLRISVQGRNLIDSKGNVVQLRGANLSGLEFVAIQGWSPNDPWGGQVSSKLWSSVLDWKMNVVRLPLNQASWLGYTCVDGLGKTRNPDPGKNYQETVRAAVNKATALGLYVIVDLHWSAPDDIKRAVGEVKAMCPLEQNPIADADHSIDFWRSIANTFKDHPNVIFELFNEPYLWWRPTDKSEWETLRDGGLMSDYVTGEGSNYQIKGHKWRAAGLQQLVDTIRATGATNVIAASGLDWGKKTDEWLTYRPNDPLKQLAAIWHAYPAFGKKWGSDAYAMPNYGKDAFTWATNILSGGFPVIITETGDRNAPGIIGAPFVSKLLPWADKNGISYLGWTFNVWQNEDNVLLKDTAGTPTDGYGVYFKKHLMCADGGEKNCP